MRFCVKRSTIPAAGQGLFAGASMARGERFAVAGVLVRKRSVENRCTRYADAYKFRVGNNLLIPLGVPAMVNHSLTPNLKKVLEGKTLYLQALRPIKRGEELFFRYSLYARKRFSA